MDTSSEETKKNASVRCGWGRALFAQTFSDTGELARALLEEKPGERDMATYVQKPHVVLSHAPQELFLDPSDMLRLELQNRDTQPPSEAFVVRPIETHAEARAISDIYLKRDMVPADSDYIWNNRDSDSLSWLVAVDRREGRVLGTVMGVDHVAAFGDPEQGSSLWCLAVDPAASVPSLGESLVRSLADLYAARGRHHMDLSVIHDNEQAKALYEKLGFEQIRYFTIKTKNVHNEALFLGPQLEEALNPYARIIVDEARARGIGTEVLDGEEGYFRLFRGGRSVVCRESLSELTSAVAMSRCQDKLVTHRWLSKAGFKTPSFRTAGSKSDDENFLEEHGSIVVKPATGEQGKGITVGVDSATAMEQAIALARQFGERVILESFHAGEDLRIVVINFKVVAASVRTPARIAGDGKRTARTLIEKASRRRSAATGGESRIPVDSETRDCLAEAGYGLDDVVPAGEEIQVRRTANLHTGGTMEDVTDRLHPELVRVAEQAAEHLDIPVVGLDLIVRSPERSEHVIIEANERPGLANHEPQPTAQRFVDLLFPLSVEIKGTRKRSEPAKDVIER